MVPFTPGSAAGSLFDPSLLTGGLSNDLGTNNFTAVTDPGVGQDSSQGYGLGSLWFNTTPGALRLWVCRSAAIGSAAWVSAGADFGNGGTDPNTEAVQFGSGTSVMAGEGNIARQIPGVAGGITPASTGGDIVVAVFTIPPNSFDAAGRGVTANASGNFAANANTKRIALWWGAGTATIGSAIVGGTLMADTGPVTTNGGGWNLSGNVFKRGAAGANTQTVTSNGAIAGSSHLGTSPSVNTSQNESASQRIAVTINCTTTATDALIAWFDVNAMN